jgi:hypothetical protein
MVCDIPYKRLMGWVAPSIGFIGITTQTPVMFTGNKAYMQVSIRSSPLAYSTLIALDTKDESFLFEVDEWCGRGMAAAIEKFYDVYPNVDSVQFGPSNIVDGARTATQQQKLNIIKYMSMDILNCIAQIILKQKLHLHGYARWYMKNVTNDTYSNLITRCACNCIWRSKIESDVVTYTLIEFTPTKHYNNGT